MLCDAYAADASDRSSLKRGFTARDDNQSLVKAT